MMKNYKVITLSLTKDAELILNELASATKTKKSKIVSLLIAGYHQQLEADLQKYVKKEEK